MTELREIASNKSIEINGVTFHSLQEMLIYMNKLRKENAKYKEMIEDMKADMCGTTNDVLCDYLVGILKKYEEIV